MRIITDGNMNFQAAYLQQASALQNAQYTKVTQGLYDAERVTENGTSFDQVDISSEATNQSNFQKELAARLVKEVRASTSTGNIRELRDQVQNGTYQYNPEMIAKAMLLEV